MESEHHEYFVYILASRSRVLYVGVTRDLSHRLVQHRRGHANAFTRKYRVDRLVYAERYRYVEDAIRREKQIKGWRRERKVELIEAANPTWRELPAGWSPSTQSSTP
jgi:putative endonuclease